MTSHILDYGTTSKNLIVARKSGLYIGSWPVGTAKKVIKKYILSIPGLSGTVKIRKELHEVDRTTGELITA